jgi:hypothetical protein
MKVKLGYVNRVVELDDETVYVFDGKLYSAPIKEVVGYYLRGTGLLPESIRTVAGDIARFLMSTGELEWFTGAQVQYGEVSE